MRQPKNFNFLPYLLVVGIILFLLAFKNTIIEAFKGIKKPAFLVPALPALPVVTPSEVIKEKQVSKPSIIKSTIQNKRSIRNIKQPFLLPLPKFDTIPFIAQTPGIWAEKPPIVDLHVKPFDSPFFNQNTFQF